jgi:hypothetical protein
MKIKEIVVLILIGFLLFTTVLISGCAQSGSSIKSTEEVGRTVENMSVKIGDLTSTLEDIDKTLG